MGCTLLGYYAASSGTSLRTFRYNLLVPSWGVETPKRNPENYPLTEESRLTLGKIRFKERGVGGGSLNFNFVNKSFNFDLCGSCWRVERF